MTDGKMNREGAKPLEGKWHGSSCWLLCLCVLCFVFCAASKTIQCSQVSPDISYFEKWKLWAMFFGGSLPSLIKLWPEKKGTVVWPLGGVNLIQPSVVSKYEHHQSHYNLRQFLLGFFILQKQWDPNFLLLCISFLLCMDLQPYIHDPFSKILRTFFASRN